MKSGTTSLFQYLNFHSLAESSLVKEPCYYSYNYCRGKAWYLSQFPKKSVFGPRKLYFDASPVYLHDANAPMRIHADYPSAKLIVVCRDPIERAISHYNYYSRIDSNFGRKPENQIDGRSIETAFDDDMDSREHRLFFRYCRMSLYAQQMTGFLAHYPREQILFIDLTTLEISPLETMLRVAAFIGLPRMDEFKSAGGSSEKVESLASFQKATEKRFKRFNSLDYDLPISVELETRMRDFFREDVMQLQEMAGMTFSWAPKYTSQA